MRDVHCEGCEALSWRQHPPGHRKARDSPKTTAHGLKLFVPSWTKLAQSMRSSWHALSDSSEHHYTRLSNGKSFIALLLVLVPTHRSQECQCARIRSAIARFNVKAQQERQDVVTVQIN